MTAEQRRQAIARRLEGAEGPVPAAALAGEFGVSRQIVVGDVALLRASGAQIYATPRGYVSGARQRGTAAAVPAATPPRIWGGSSMPSWTTAARWWT